MKGVNRLPSEGRCCSVIGTGIEKGYGYYNIPSSFHTIATHNHPANTCSVVSVEVHSLDIQRKFISTWLHHFCVGISSWGHVFETEECGLLAFAYCANRLALV